MMPSFYFKMRRVREADAADTTLRDRAGYAEVIYQCRMSSGK